MGKIIALVVAIATCAFPLGQAMYGVLFDVLKDQVWLVIALSLLVSMVAQMNLRKLNLHN